MLEIYLQNEPLSKQKAKYIFEISCKNVNKQGKLRPCPYKLHSKKLNSIIRVGVEYRQEKSGYNDDQKQSINFIEKNIFKTDEAKAAIRNCI